jgi:hypothetical protein
MLRTSTAISVSRAIPGRKNYAVVETGGTKEHKQKRVLHSLSEVFIQAEFKESHPGLKAGFSKSASL